MGIWQLQQEENGVKWYEEDVEYSRVNKLQHMEFEGQVLSGSWCLPRAIFWALVSMTPEERGKFNPREGYDRFVGEIGHRLYCRKFLDIYECQRVAALAQGNSSVAHAYQVVIDAFLASNLVPTLENAFQRAQEEVQIEIYQKVLNEVKGEME